MLTKYTLQLTAAMLGRKHKIAVEFQPQSTACTNGKTIILPLLPAPTDPKSAHEILSLMRGYIDHEASHLRWTAFDDVKDLQKENPKIFHLVNILEDIRVEKLLSKTYPGCKENLSDLVKVLKRKKQFGFGNKTVTDALMGYVSYRLRFAYLGQDLDNLAQKGKEILSAYLTANAITKLDGIMDQIRVAESTEDSVRIAQEILKTFNNSKQADKSKGSDSSPDDKQDGKGNHSPAPDPNNPSESNQDKDGDSKDKKDSGSDGASGKSETGQDNSNSSCSNQNTLESSKPDKDNQDGKDSKPGRKEQLNKLPSGLMTIGDALKEILGKAAAQAANNLENSRVDQTAGSELATSNRLTTPIDMAKARQLANNIRLQTTAYLEAKSFAKKALSSTGRKINGRKLYKASTPDPRIFQKTAQTKEINTDLYLIMDRSGSMSGDKIIHAGTTALAFAWAYQKIKGVSLTVVAFPGDLHSTVIPLAINGDSISPKRFRIEPGGGTPMATPLRWVLQRVFEEPNNHKKVVVIVTDGDPDDVKKVYNAINELKSFVDTVLMVGIPSCNMGTMEYLVGKDKYIMVDDMEKLPRQLADLFRKNLL